MNTGDDLGVLGDWNDRGVIGIWPADYTDAHAATCLIATAFHPLDVAAWLVPHPDERARVLYANFRIHVDHALTHGQVWMTGRRGGAAVWFLRDTALAPLGIEDYDHRLKLACGPHTDRFRILDDAFAKHHPDTPHHHLAFLAVHPLTQGRGHGSALLTHRHQALDTAGIPAYLEASNERNRALYARHGYAEHGPPIQLPDGPRLWPMWREPRPVGAPR